MSGNIAVSFAFSAMFREMGWMPLGGLALANSLATTLECLALIILLSKRVNGLNMREILQTGVKSLLASLVMGGVLLLWLNFFGARNKFLVLIGGLGLGVLVYALMIWLLKVPELQGIVNRLKGMLKRKNKSQAESPD
jgi:putative peptidoglycan lipid II flippase